MMHLEDFRACVGPALIRLYASKALIGLLVLMYTQ